MITTNRCVLTRVGVSDFDDIFELLQNEEVRKYLGGIPDVSRVEKQFHHMIRSEDQYYWCVRRSSDDALLGLVSLDTYHDTSWIELSYQFFPVYWGQQYAYEVAKAVLAFGFDVLHLSCIVSETQTANTRSCRLLERLGMNAEKTVIRFSEQQTVYVMKKEGMTDDG